jgi:serine/threonine protein phosphatase PrpC
MIYKFCTATDTGRIRANNEDAVAFDPRVGLAVLADGMGGYNAGEVASSMATSHIADDLGRWLAAAGGVAARGDVRRALEICVDNANASIFKAAQANANYAGMGTTLVVGVFRDDWLLLGHIGDSRCYRWRRGELTQLTRDHSLLQEQIDAGLLTPQQAAVSVNKNLVTRALGVESAVALEVTEHRVETGDLYLFCSDGLSDMVSDAMTAGLLAQPASLAQQADRLVAAANAQGGRDNITVLLAQASEVQPVAGGQADRGGNDKSDIVG